jgi:uncharacterized membrane-anchored protein YhcB (DUF1043 family)
LYVPAGRRRRNLILGLVGALVVGVIIGIAVGRVTAPTVGDKVSSVQSSADEVTARLRATPVEYRQELQGSSEFRRGGTVLDGLAEARTSLDTTLADATWLGRTQRRDADAALAALVDAARAKVAADRYAQLVDASANRIDAVFGLR